MKYLEFTFRTVPCTEIVNDVLSGVLGDDAPAVGKLLLRRLCPTGDGMADCLFKVIDGKIHMRLLLLCPGGLGPNGQPPVPGQSW